MARRPAADRRAAAFAAVAVVAAVAAIGAATRGLGENCDGDKRRDTCKDGFACRVFGGITQCTPALKAGEDCTYDTDCAPGADCDSVCVEAVGVGDACDGSLKCGGKASCDALGTKICRAFSQEGEACKTSDECDSGLFCSVGAVCAPRLAAGAPCKLDLDCQVDLWCRDDAGKKGMCGPLSARGEACSYDYHCHGNMNCYGGVCIVRKGVTEVPAGGLGGEGGKGNATAPGPSAGASGATAAKRGGSNLPLIAGAAGGGLAALALLGAACFCLVKRRRDEKLPGAGAGRAGGPDGRETWVDMMKMNVPPAEVESAGDGRAAPADGLQS